MTTPRRPSDGRDGQAVVGAAGEGKKYVRDGGDGNDILVRPRTVAAVLTILRTDQGTLSIDRTPSGSALGAILVAAEDEMANQKVGPRYRADITAGSLKVTESRRIADLLLHKIDADGWTDAIVKRNILQARTPATARRLARLIRSRLEPMGPDLWKLVRDGKGSVATHAVFSAAVKQSPLLGDFLGMVVADQYRRFGKTVSNKMFADYLDGCRERDPLMPAWTEETRERIRSSVFQMLAQAGYIENTRSLKLQSVHIADQVIHGRATGSFAEDRPIRGGGSRRGRRGARTGRIVRWKRGGAVLEGDGTRGTSTRAAGAFAFRP